MHRMIFEDFRLLVPEIEITFACPKQYHEAVIDHPFIDHVVEQADGENYGAVYDTSWACNRYEMRTAPFIDKHRSDIWAEHCGLTLTKHEMHFWITDQEKAWAADKVKDTRKVVLFAPISAMIGKNLSLQQMQFVLDALKDYRVIVLHNRPISINAEQITDCTIRQFMAMIDRADYVVSVDSAALHCAGGMGKPTTGIFSFVDGLTYTKYYENISLVQLHRAYTSGWTCGPCFNYMTCPKLIYIAQPRKPCITEITRDMIVEGINKMLNG